MALILKTLIRVRLLAEYSSGIWLAESVLVVLVVVLVVLVVAFGVVVVASHYNCKESHHKDHQNHHQDHQNSLRQPYSGAVFRQQPTPRGPRGPPEGLPRGGETLKPKKKDLQKALRA